MALAAFIAAYQDSKEVGAPLRATLPLGGRSLVERQARLALAAGAERILILVERLPAELLAAIDRMRAEGIPVVMARTAQEAAAQVDDTDRIMLVADGFMADDALMRRVAASQGATVLTVPDAGYDERYERIDSGSRWAGLALLDGVMRGDQRAVLLEQAV